MSDHENTNPRQQSVEVLAITLLDMFLHDVMAPKSLKPQPEEQAPVAIRSPEQRVRIS